ncbi:MAG TPA: sensor histidine kinase [Candidatus Limnocylindrales bacterium]|nr:sensor histidine kinase [Candidatus Limnocylindrales bacterium]
MINPLSAQQGARSLAPTAIDDRSGLAAVRAWLGRLGRARVLVALDLTAAMVIGAAFAQVGPPELLFHVAFVILTAEAFVFGRRICLQRIAATSVALVAYAALPVVGFRAMELELTEWPLMFTIAVLVAWMADREQSVGRRYAELYRETRDRLVRAQEEERARIARDLHDGIGQTLTALALTLDAAANERGGTTAVDRGRELAREALDDTRHVAERIRPPRLAELGLAGVLRSLAPEGSGPLEVVILDRGARLGPEEELETYRIVQEAIRNALTHAAARRIVVSLVAAGDALTLSVVDDGVGFDPDAVPPHRLGIVGMAERAAAIGGRLTVVSRRGHGTRVELVVPLRPRSAMRAADVPR